MAYEKITDRQWDAMSQHLPRPAGTGRPRADDRRTVNAIFFVLITGCVWNKLPKEYGSKSTARRRLQDWQEAGVWQRMLRGAARSAHAQNKLGMQRIAAGSTTVPSKKGARA